MMDRIAPFHLRTLLAIARLGTFQGAAERMNMTQPAVSARMRELELQLGTKLFQREGRRMILTARGRQLVVDAERVLANLDQMLINASAKSYATGVVRVSTGEIASASCLPRFVQRVYESFPEVTLEIEVDLTARMLENLLAAKNDIVFLAGPVVHPAIETRSLGSLELVWLTASVDSARASTNIPRAFWSLPPHSPIYHVVCDEIKQRGLPCLSLNTCNNVRSLIDIVAESGGVGLFPETMIRDEMVSGRLTEVFVRPRMRIEFQSAIRKREVDPLILSIFEYTHNLQVNPNPT